MKPSLRRLACAVVLAASGGVHAEPFVYAGLSRATTLEDVARRYPNSLVAGAYVHVSPADVHDHVHGIELAGPGGRLRISFAGPGAKYPPCGPIEKAIASGYGPPAATREFSEEVARNRYLTWRLAAETVQLQCFKGGPGAGYLAEAVAVYPRAPAQSRPPPADAGWAGLYTPALLGWLENLNRLEALCAHAAADAARSRACRDEQLRPMQFVVPLRRDPQEESPPEGALVVRGTPGEPLRASYAPPGGGAETPFIPDLYDADWGYGPYFHQTFLDRRGAWFLLPAGPWPRPAWGRFVEPQVRLLRELKDSRTVVRTPAGDLVILGLGRRDLRARPAQAADHWCEAAEPPPLKPWKEIRIPTAKLYDAAGHLRIDVKHKRGC